MKLICIIKNIYWQIIIRYNYTIFYALILVSVTLINLFIFFYSFLSKTFFSLFYCSQPLLLLRFLGSHIISIRAYLGTLLLYLISVNESFDVLFIRVWSLGALLGSKPHTSTMWFFKDVLWKSYCFWWLCINDFCYNVLALRLQLSSQFPHSLILGKTLLATYSI